MVNIYRQIVPKITRNEIIFITKLRVLYHQQIYNLWLYSPERNTDGMETRALGDTLTSLSGSTFG